MKNSVYISIFCLSFLLVSIIIDNALCSPQLTFSSDWSGGKRELDDTKAINFNNIDSDEKNSEIFDKRSPGWGKRSPGWGKRSMIESSNIVKLVNRLKEYEDKATELRNLLSEIAEVQSYNTKN